MDSIQYSGLICILQWECKGLYIMYLTIIYIYIHIPASHDWLPEGRIWWCVYTLFIVYYIVDILSIMVIIWLSYGQWWLYNDGKSWLMMVLYFLKGY